MKLRDYLKEEDVTQSFFIELLEAEGIKISKVAFWKWLTGKLFLLAIRWRSYKS